jgi:hypothetical protein
MHTAGLFSRQRDTGGGGEASIPEVGRACLVACGHNWLEFTLIGILAPEE